MKLRAWGILLATIAAGCSSNTDGNGSGGSGNLVDASGSGGQGAGGSGTGDTAGAGGAREAGTLATFGDPCTDAAQCVTYGGVPAVCMPDWPGGGYCTNEHCSSTLTCAPGTDCKPYQGEQRCFRRCGTGCRTGYTCQDGVCLPPP